MMKISKTRRWLLWGTLLALSVLAAAQVAGESETPVEPVLATLARPRPVRTGFPAKAPDPAPGEEISHLYLRTAEQEIQDVFAPQSWYRPPEPVAAAAAAPSAPPLPFVYLGKLVEDGKPTIFLGRDAKHYVVREGDTIDDTYRVVTIRGGLMELTYIPLGIRQTLAVGEPH
jgi:hypothetical protein